jgi:hypothetical protein
MRIISDSDDLSELDELSYESDVAPIRKSKKKQSYDLSDEVFVFNKG